MCSGSSFTPSSRQRGPSPFPSGCSLQPLCYFGGEDKPLCGAMGCWAAKPRSRSIPEDCSPPPRTHRHERLLQIRTGTYRGKGLAVAEDAPRGEGRQEQSQELA